MKFEPDRWEVYCVAVSGLIALVGVMFSLRFLTGLAVGGLCTILLIIFFTARR